ncbi:MAG: hypothetical protein AAF961_09245, partial [Planctomycetota bacterium]
SIGAAEASFKTQWYEKKPDEPDQVGEVELELSLDGERVAFQSLGAYAEPNRQAPRDDQSGRKPPTVVLYGRRASNNEQLTLGIGLARDNFRPTKEGSVPVEGIVITGNPIWFFASMAMGASDLMWIRGTAQFEQAEMNEGAPVHGSMDLKILKMIDD